MNRNVLILGLVACANIAMPSLADADEVPRFTQAGEPLECNLSGEVSGPGHRLVIPEGLMGCPGWHRVFMVPVASLDEDRYILVSYNQVAVISLPSVDELAAHSQYTAIERLSHDSIEINGMPGERTVDSYKDWRGTDTISEDVLLTSTLPSTILEDAPLFQLSLRLITTPESHPKDREVFELLLRSVEQDADAE